MNVYIIPFACFLATYILGIVIGRKTMKIDMERKAENESNRQA